MSETNAYIYVGNAVKAIGNGRIEGYLVPFTSPDQPDLDGEYFNAETELHLKDHPVEGLRVMYQHGLDETLGVKTFGKIIKARIDDVGLWVQAQLDLADEYQKAVYELAESGKLGWSSGALPQSVKVADNGHIKSWAIIEGSLTPTPAMPFKTKIQAKSALIAEVTGDVTQSHDNATNTPIESQSVKGTIKMDKEQIIALLDEIMALLREDESMMAASEEDLKQVSEEVQKSASELKPEAITEERIMAMVTESIKTINAKKAQRKQALAEALKNSAPPRPKSDGFIPHGTPETVSGKSWQDRVSVGETLKYADATVSDMAFGALVGGKMNDVEWMRHLVGKAEDMSNDTSVPYKQRLQIKSMLPIKANEIDGSSNSGFGSNWVATMWTSDVWQVARYDTLYDRFVSKGMRVQQLNSAGTATFPTEGADPTAYTVPEAIDVDAVGRPEITGTISPFGTGSVSVTPLETKIITTFTDRLVENSSVDVFAQANYQVTTRLQEVRDEILINGDTATGATTNINDIAGTPAGTEYWLAANGFRKYALVTATAYSADASAALTEDTWNTAVATLPAKLRWRKANTMLVVDPDTHQASMMIPEMKEYMNTTNTGDLSVFQGHDIAPSGFLALSNAAGKIDLDTPANNAKGTILALYLPYWGVGYSRQITVTSVSDPFSGTTSIIATFRMGVVNIGGGASVAVYNVGV